MWIIEQNDNIKQAHKMSTLSIKGTTQDLRVSGKRSGQFDSLWKIQIFNQKKVKFENANNFPFLHNKVIIIIYYCTTEKQLHLLLL